MTHNTQAPSRLFLLLCVARVVIAAPSAAQQEGTGLVLTPPETYKKIPVASSPLMGDLPPSVDWTNYFPKPGDQGAQGSCSAWTVAYAVKTFNEKLKRSWPLDDDARRFSPASVYNMVKRPVSPCSGGIQIDVALEHMKTWGVLPLSLMPYDPGDCAHKPGPALAATAADYKIEGYRRVSTRNVAALKSQLAAGFPIVFAINIDQAFREYAGGTYIYRPPHRRPSLHAVTLIGYDDTRRAFKLFNSWGTEWGEGGYGWISYGSLRSGLVLQAWVVDDYMAAVAPNTIASATGTPPLVPPAAETPDTTKPSDTNAFSAAIVEKVGTTLTTDVGPLQVGMNVSTPSGRGVVLSVPVHVEGGKGRTAHVIVRFLNAEGISIRADTAQASYYRDATGDAASTGITEAIESDNYRFVNREIFMPFGAFLQSTGGAQEYHVEATAYLYIDNFEVNRTAPLLLTVRY